MRNSLQKGVEFLFIASDDAIHHILSTTIVPFYIFLQILGLCQNTLTFLNHMMLAVMAKKSKREGENGRYAYRQRENVFLTPEIKKKKKKKLCTHISEMQSSCLHLEVLQRKLKRAIWCPNL